LRRRGQAIGPLDGLIAGQALARSWTLVTANRREFDRIEGLNVIDWTQPAD
jgi:tRNA(fMet)-specific endonuclease VapC